VSASPGGLNSCLPTAVMNVRPFETLDSAARRNGELLALAEEHFDVLVTIDKNIRYQQNLMGRNIAILIIRPASNDLDDIRPHVPHALVALQSLKPGQIVEVGILG
jgi:hypothetical protein